LGENGRRGEEIMPVRAIYRKGKKIGYKWGRSGKLYSCKQEGSCEKARKKAEAQARAIYASGWRE